MSRGVTGGGLAVALEGRRVAICCGSGGVGKTTSAAAVGLAAALRRRERVLVLTIDPAKRLADALGVERLGNTATRVDDIAGPGELWVAMLDTAASWDDLVHRHAPDRSTERQILANPLYRNITQRFVQSHDYIAMERLFELHRSNEFDLIVIDTPPSRHALDFLDAPERMADFFSSTLLRWITMPYRLGGKRAGRLGYLAAKPFYQVADRILGSKFLEDIAEFFLLFQSMYDGFVRRARAVTTLLHDPVTTFVVVSTLEPSPLHEAEFFMAELARRRLRLGALILNRVLPPVFADPAAKTAALRVVAESADATTGSTTDRRMLVDVANSFLRFNALAEHEEAQRRRLASQPEIVLRVPQLEGDLTSIEGLTRIADELWDGGDVGDGRVT